MQWILISGKTGSGTGVTFLHFLGVTKAYKSQKSSSRYLFTFGRYDDCTVLGRTPCIEVSLVWIRLGDEHISWFEHWNANWFFCLTCVCGCVCVCLSFFKCAEQFVSEYSIERVDRFSRNFALCCKYAIFRLHFAGRKGARGMRVIGAQANAWVCAPKTDV